MTLNVALLLAACGGSGGGFGAPAGPLPPSSPPAPATTLSVSVASLALAAINATALPAAIPGNPRKISVSNAGTQPALNMAVDASLLPVGTTVSANTCTGTLATGATCTVTITPATTATTLPVTLTVSGSNTNTVSTSVSVLAYGSQYQGGYVFALDDGTADTGSVGGKVTASTEAPAGMWSVLPLGALADHLTDGAANTAAILTAFNDPVAYPATAVAARACEEYSDAVHTDWYLPAICELGYDDTGVSGCGDQAAPLIQNVQKNIVDGGVVGGAPGVFWSSTQSGGSGSALAWAQNLQNGASVQSSLNKVQSNRLLCVRALTY